jgi:hypothetical protein
MMGSNKNSYATILGKQSSGSLIVSVLHYYPYIKIEKRLHPTASKAAAFFSFFFNKFEWWRKVNYS